MAQSIRVVDRFGKLVLQKAYKTPPSRAELADDARRATESSTEQGNSADTDDVCFEGGGVDPTTCGIEGGTVSITWTLSPQPPSGTIVSYSDAGLPNGLADQDIFNPPYQASQPYTTTQQIVLDANAPVSSNYVVEMKPSCSNGVACVGQKQGLSVLCSISAEHCPNLQINDAAQGYAVAAPSPVGTPLTVVGRQQNVSTNLIPQSGTGSYTLSDYSWTIQGDSLNPASVAKNYSFNDSGASETLLNEADLTQSSLSYYWLIGSGPLGLINNPPSQQVNGMAVSLGTSAVSSSAIAMRSDNQEQALLSATATYDVDAPNLSAVASLAANEAQYGPYALDAQLPSGSRPVHAGVEDALSLGTALAFPASAGMETNLVGTMPRSSGGQVAMTQLIHYSRTVTPLPGQVASPGNDSSGQQYIADGCALYTTNPDGSAGTTRSLENTASLPIAFATVDSPAEYPVATNDQSLALSQDYKDYYMFRPDGPNTIWVSLGKTTWSWTGRVDLGSNGSYGLTYSTSPSNPIFSLSNTELPQWSGARPNGFACHSTSGS